jgi:hypothetical protein
LKSNDIPQNWKSIPSCVHRIILDIQYKSIMLQYEHIQDLWYITKSPFISLLHCLLCLQRTWKHQNIYSNLIYTWTWIMNKLDQESHIYTLHCLLAWFCWFYLFDASWSLCSWAYLLYNIHTVIQPYSSSKNMSFTC